MKKIRDGIVYVDIEDLVHLGLIAPVSESDAKRYYSTIDNCLKFKGEKSKEFFMNCEDVYDYDYITSLTDEEISSMLIKIETEIFFREGQSFNLVTKDEYLTKEEDKKKRLKTLYYQKETLTKFLKKREENSIKL